MKQWYKEVFTNFANTYDKEEFTKGTIREVDFLESEIESDHTKQILDVGCGTGRHAIELAKRGYQVTGIDLSEDQLNKAREKAGNEGVEVTFLQRDARDFSFGDPFDLVIMICEGAFPLMETGEMNYEILKHATKSLKEGGKFIFTTLNGLFPLYHSVEEFCASTSEEGNATTYRSNTFDLMTFRDYNITEVEDDDGNKKELECNERYYVPSEISWLLKTLGYIKIEIFGAKLGAFSRNDKLTTEDFEMLVIAQK